MTQPRRLIPIGIVLLGLLGVLGGWGASRVTAQTTPTVPPDVTLSLRLGEQGSTSLTLSNPGTTPLTITLYEAYPPQPTTVAVAASPADEIIPPFPRPALTAPLLVYFKESADLTPAYAISDWTERGEMVYRLLSDHAAQSQARLQAELTQRGYAFQSFWVVNALAVEGDADVMAWLAEQPEVAAVHTNERYVRQLPRAESDDPDSLAAGAVAWHVRLIGASAVWDTFGVEGEGITVANIDSGVTWTHPALRSHYRGSSDNRVSHAYNWVDTTAGSESPAPIDPVGHGTHVMGIMAGSRGRYFLQSGIAPDVRWIAARGCGAQFCEERDLLEAAQWMLAPTDPTGAQPRPDMRPHIINNSWGFAEGGSAWFEGVLSAWRAAGIFAPFAAGNNGPGCSTIDAPAYSPNAFAIGATRRDMTIAPFSALGPTYDGRIKPDLVAPGARIYSAYNDGRFITLSGTSMATPMVAGAVALLWSANPALIGDVAATESLLRDTATPFYAESCGDAEGAHPNNVFGMGLLNMEAAIRAAGVDVGWFSLTTEVVIPPNSTVDVPVTFDAGRVPQIGTYNGRIVVESEAGVQHSSVRMVVLETPNTIETFGRVVDSATGAGIAGTVHFGAGVTVPSAQDGSFSARVPQGEYAITATAQGYLPITATYTLTPSTFLTLPLILDAPRLELELAEPPLTTSLAWGSVEAYVIELYNAGTQPLVITPTIAADEWQVTPIEIAAPYRLTTMHPIRLGNDQVYLGGVHMPFTMPLFSRYVNRLYPSSNGWVSPVITGDARRVVGCLPNGFATRSMLAPFWADLDPGQGGSIQVGMYNADTYVVNYEKVPLRNPSNRPSPPTYSFQIAFHRDGMVEYRYGQMGEMPLYWASGVNTGRERGQSFGCFDEPRSLSYTAVEMRNQPNPQQWLAVDSTPIVIPPQTAAQIPFEVRGFAYAPWLEAPMQGRLHLTTNDLRYPVADVPVYATISAPPHQTWLPFTGAKAIWQFYP